MITRDDQCACKAMDQYNYHTSVLCAVHVHANKQGFASILLNINILKGHFTHILPKFTHKLVVISSHTDSFGFIFPGFELYVSDFWLYYNIMEVYGI